ncbi:phosphotransferase IIA-like nitrogen-regulatory protein PtsN [Mesocricetibacter intestinalis]|uniref:Phosphotransferase IIA-like nitrogen-regulatory protein PtsN n=1 Tax=Mesocricetibacter intestinalis TaxID=1521930 RepID=A0A4R6V8L4_9PAST|nr:PTS IIA-like nitrogen regulatory protein PtsN [Mesocricetibacter intestinalis]TDQ57918.1 phosphotransferase IIA-like nitrogen-regulatory protein PtsN [Mesocricetibacter intestinalis]
MIKFSALLAPENIRQGVVCSSKKRVLEMIGHIVAQQQQTEIKSIDEIQCFENLCSREKLGNTSLGNGVAIPRAKLPEGNEACAVFLQLASPIDYDSADKREIDLIFALLIPENRCAEYTEILPELAEKLSDKNLCKQLRNAQSADEIRQIFDYADSYLQEQKQAQNEEAPLTGK